MYHPSGETNKPEKLTGPRVDIFKVQPTLCLIYVEYQDYVGAIDIPDAQTAQTGTVVTDLIKWLRPKSKEIQYMGPNCDYEAVDKISITVNYIWSN